MSIYIYIYIYRVQATEVFCKCTCVHSVVFAPPPADGITPTQPTPHPPITPTLTPARKRLAIIHCSTVSVGPNSNNS